MGLASALALALALALGAGLALGLGLGLGSGLDALVAHRPAGRLFKRVVLLSRVCVLIVEREAVLR